MIRRQVVTDIMAAARTVAIIGLVTFGTGVAQAIEVDKKEQPA